MSIPEAIKGAQAEFARISSPIEKAKRALIYFRIFAAELFGTITLAPFGARSYLLHRSLPNAAQWGSKKHQGVSIVRDVRYGATDRNTMDIYLPPSWDDENEKTNPRPTVLFCHGGVWATGAKWHYAPLATRLAQAGIITAIMQYTLYPDAQAQDMAKEVSLALSAVMDSAVAHGGDDEAVSLMGHSAGAQLCAMALLHRAHQAGTKPSSIAKPPSEAPQKQKSLDAAYDDTRMPKRFISMAGVFDIAKHYEYEEGRHVHELSTMARAVGGPENFAAQSPAVILQQAVLREQQGKTNTKNPVRLSSTKGPTASPASPSSASSSSSYYKSFELQGEGIAHRIGFTRTSLSPSEKASEAASFSTPPLCLSPSAALAQGILPLTATAAKRLPPTYLQSSCSDVTVPWFESADMHWALTDCGVPAKSLVYNGIGHGDFVVEWRPAATLSPCHDCSDLPPFAADVVKILSQ